MADSGEPDCRLVDPYEIIGNDLSPITLKKWPFFTDQTEILIRSENILTITNPKKEIAKKYLELSI